MRRAVLAAWAAAALALTGTAAAQNAPRPGAPLRIGLMPAVNSIPLIVADHLGWFERLGVEVELVMFQDQLTRETALQTGRVDGSISDLVNAVAARASGFDVRVVSGTDGVFALLGAPDGRLRSLEDWKARPRVRTGLVESSIVTFLTEKMLRAGGVDPRTVELVNTLQVPARMELLLSGRIDAACLPEPMAAVAVRRGAVRIVDSTALATTPGVLLFTGRAVREHGREIAALLDACDRAVAELNRNGNAFRPLVVARGGFPEEARDGFVLPRFHPAAPPTLEEVAEVERWMESRGLLRTTVAYEDLVARVR